MSTKKKGVRSEERGVKPMPKHMLAALRKSIAHWGRMMVFGSQSEETPDGHNCALCRVSCMTCGDCPVFLVTRLRGCEGTPYLDARAAWLFRGLDSAEFKTAAAKELAFLISLIPTASGRARLLKRYRINKEGVRA